MAKIVNKCVVSEVATEVRIELTQDDILKWLEGCDISEIGMLKDIYKKLRNHIYYLEYLDDDDDDFRSRA